MLETLPPPGQVRTLEDGRRLMSRPMSGGLGKLEPLYLPSGIGDRLEYWGEAEVRNGPGLCRIEGCGCGESHFVARNKIVGQGLRHLCNILRFGQLSGAVPAFETNQLARSYIRVGTGSGATIDTTTALVTQVATSPSSTSITLTNPSAGVYRTHFAATWVSGSITGATVTEIGVFGALGITLDSNVQTNLALFSRLSVSDSEFSSFVINTAAPLVIEYRITYAFV